MSSAWLSYLGISTNLLQPPLPEGDPADVVLGTKDWKRVNPLLTSKRAKMVWIDMKQRDEKTHGQTISHEQSDELMNTKGRGYDNWWPGMRRWHLGIYCEDAILEFGEPEILNG